MIVIEAVRTSTWNAITGQRQVLTVPTCVEELGRGDPGVAGYVTVGKTELARLSVEPLPMLAAATLRLRSPDADGMDAGERDLLALAASRSDDFELSSADKAAVRAAHALGLLDRVVSLEAVIQSVGARPLASLKKQFTEPPLSSWRTQLRLGLPL